MKDIIIRAADSGDIEAQFALGLMYLNGDGVKKDSQETFSWFQKAAELGYVEAQLFLQLHEINKAVEKLGNLGGG